MERDLYPYIFCLLIFSIMGFPCGSAGKESAFNAGDLGLILGLGRSPGEGKDYPLQYSGLENPMDCMYIVHGVSKGRTQLSHAPYYGLACQKSSPLKNNNNNKKKSNPFLFFHPFHSNNQEMIES